MHTKFEIKNKIIVFITEIDSHSVEHFLDKTINIRMYNCIF